MGGVKAIDPVYDELIERIGRFSLDLEARIDLPGVTIRHAFLATTHASDTTTVAETTCEWQYRRAKIEWFLPALMTNDDAALREIVAHEYAHVLIGSVNDRLKSGSEDHLEIATENVARAIIAALRGT